MPETPRRPPHRRKSRNARRSHGEGETTQGVCRTLDRREVELRQRARLPRQFLFSHSDWIRRRGTSTSYLRGHKLWCQIHRRSSSTCRSTNALCDWRGAQQKDSGQAFRCIRGLSRAAEESVPKCTPSADVCKEAASNAKRSSRCEHEETSGVQHED